MKRIITILSLLVAIQASAQVTLTKKDSVKLFNASGDIQLLITGQDSVRIWSVFTAPLRYLPLMVYDQWGNKDSILVVKDINMYFTNTLGASLLKFQSALQDTIKSTYIEIKEKSK